MTRRTVIAVTDALLVLLTLIGAFLIDQSVAPANHFVSAPFAVPVLIAAYRLPMRGAIVTAILTFGVAAFSAFIDQSPFVPVLFHMLGLLLSSILAILLARQYRVSTRLARDAQWSLRQAQETRHTVQTIVETVPIGVLMANGHGRILYTNAAAHAIVGGAITGSVYGPLGSYALLNRDGTPFPLHNLPLRRALEHGEITHDLEIVVRRADGTERVILAGGTPVRDEEGRVTDAVAVFQDLTDRLRTEEALRESQESLARAQEVAHLGNWERDLHTGQLRWSDEIYRIFGITPQAFAGTFEAFLQRVHPDDRDWVTRCLREALTKGHAYSVDHRISCPDGTVRYVHEEAQVLYDASGQPVRLLGTVQDITDRKGAEQERERLLQQVQVERARVEAILNSTANGIIYIDAASKRVQANPAAVQLFGHEFVPEKGQTQYLSQLLHPDDRPATLEELPSHRALQEQTTDQAELIVVKPDQTRVPIVENAAPVCAPGGPVVGAVLVFQDISALKEVERLREEWTSVIAHDLRQPVTVIIGYGTSLLRVETTISTEHRRKIEHILTAAENLNKMIADLLDVSRIETRRLVLQLKPTDLPALVAAVVERTAAVEAASGHAHPIQINVAGPIPPVLADPARIEQVLGNLLSNAAKYSDPDSEITMEVRQQGDNVLISVINRGPGIPPDEVVKLFTRFYRTREARASRTEGLGVGLYISKGIVETHHGRIWVQSIPGQTTTFFFTLPLASAASTEARS